MLLGWDSPARHSEPSKIMPTEKKKDVMSDVIATKPYRFAAYTRPHRPVLVEHSLLNKQLSFYQTAFEQPLPICNICFAQQQQQQHHQHPGHPHRQQRPSTARYVNLLDISFNPQLVSVPSASDTNTNIGEGDSDNGDLSLNQMHRRWFADIRYTFTTPLSHKYPSVTQLVLQSPRVTNTVEMVSATENCALRVIKKRAVKFLFEMKANFSKVICKCVAYLLFKVFRHLMSHLLVCPIQMERLQQAEKSGIPILYLPLHRSHLDYLLVTWTVWHWGLRLPHIASGDNLNLSGFGWLLRATGAFFIRRRVGGESNPAACDQLYRCVLNSYMTEVLKQSMPIEFFLEGTRSRFGKTLLPKNGLISNIVSAVQQGAIKDVWMVPVSYTYDQTAEGIFFNELMGMRKQRESVWQVIKGIVRSLGSGRCGAVRINFGTPVLLSEYVMALEGKVSRLPQNQSTLRHEVRMNSYRELLPWHCISSKPDSTLIRSIGYHIVYDAQMQSSLSICSVLSTLLLCKYRNEVALDVAVNEFVWLCDLMDSFGFDVVGWNGDYSDGYALFERARSLLGESVIEMDGNVIVRNTHQDILNLAYHKNALLHIFSIISSVSIAVLTLRSVGCTEPILVEMSWLICDLLQYEFLFCKPCESLRKRIEQVVVQMRSMNGGLLLFNNNTYDATGDHNNFITILNEEAEQLLKFYSNMLRPFLQSMYIILDKLIALTMPFEGKGADFVRHQLSQPKNHIDTPFTLLTEALNADSFNNALRLFHEKGLLAAGPVVAIANVEQASTLLQSLKTILCDSQ